MVNLLDRLDRLGPVCFTLTLYVARWLVLLPMMPILSALTPSGPANRALVEKLQSFPLGGLFLSTVLVAPVLETLIECTLPCLLLQRLAGPPRNPPARLRRRTMLREPRGQRRPQERPWILVGFSAAIMVLLHPLEVRVIVPTAITGAFLGYTYGHLVARGHVTAFLATTAFHGGINMVGVAILAFQ